jgi:hypothetical protein
MSANMTVPKTVKKVEVINQREILSTGSEVNNSKNIVEKSVKETKSTTQKNL